jgi:hypothetical protein
VVIGNPPYVSANNMELEDRDYFNNNESYFSTTKKWDLYVLFVEKGLKLLKHVGYFSVIIPYGILNQPFAETIRQYIIEDTKINKILDLHENKIFEDATVPTCVLVLNKNGNKFKDNLNNISKIEFLNENSNTTINSHNTPQKEFHQFEQHMIRTENIVKYKGIIKKVDNLSKSLKELTYVSTGAEIYSKEPGGHSKFDLLYKEYKKDHKPYIEGSAIEKSKRGRYCHPAVDYYLDYQADIMRSPKFKELFESDKIIIRRSSGELGILATLDNRELYTSEKTLIVISKEDLPDFKIKNESLQLNINLKYILGILNSKLIDFYYKNQFAGFIDVYPSSLEKMPIVYDKSLKQENRLIENVDTILNSRKKLEEIKNIILINLINKYTSQAGPTLKTIVKKDGFFNKIYSGRARKIREITVNINDNIITLYSDKSSSGQYELMKFELKDRYKRQYIKYYLENLTDEQLAEFNEFSGGLVKKVLQIQLPDYDKYNVVPKVVNQWNQLQKEINKLENQIEETDREIDQMVYELYNLTAEEIKIVEESLE